MPRLPRLAGDCLQTANKARGGHAIIKMPRLHLSCGQLLADRGKSKKCDFCFFRIFWAIESLFLPRAAERAGADNACWGARALILAFPLGGRWRRSRRKRGAGPLSCHSEEQSDEGSQTERIKVGSDPANVGRKRKEERRKEKRRTEARSAQARRQGHQNKP